MSAYDAAAERAVLAIMLQQPRSIAEAQLILTGADFFSTTHELLFTTMCELAEKGDVDPALVASTLASRGLAVRHNTTPLLAELVGSLVVAANLSYHALRVRELSRVRRFRGLIESAMQAVEETERGWWESKDRNQPEVDLDRLQTRMAHLLVQGELLVDENMEDQAIEGLSSFTEFLAEPDREQDWLVPDFMERQDVWMILGGEGGGKSTLSRQFVLAMGAGLHPLDEEFEIPPVNSLLIDLENAPSMLRRQSRGIHHNVLAYGDAQAVNEHTWVWRRPGGLNLRLREHQVLFRAVLDRVRPEFVALGSLYNAFSRMGDDWETAAEEVKEFLNVMRNRYSCAFLLEHHMPKGSGQADRPQTPYGSSVWQRWVTHGRVIHKVAENLYELALFRGDRDQRRIPAGLSRGGPLPWSPIWTSDDLDARIEAAEEPRRRLARI